MMMATVAVFLSPGLSESTKQAFLELLCFYNCEDTLPEDLIEERWFRHGGRHKDKQRKTWK
jgi:pentatricopeptide repeat domain-containing protein 3